MVLFFFLARRYDSKRLRGDVIDFNKVDNWENLKRECTLQQIADNIAQNNDKVMIGLLENWDVPYKIIKENENDEITIDIATMITGKKEKDFIKKGYPGLK